MHSQLKSGNPYAPSQAHLQGTQSRHTKANLAKEPALFLRFRDTPYFGGHRLQFKSPRRRANIQQGVCCYAGRRIYSQLHIAISPYPADGILSAFVIIFIISFSISSGSGLDIIKYQHSSKL